MTAAPARSHRKSHPRRMTVSPARSHPMFPGRKMKFVRSRRSSLVRAKTLATGRLRHPLGTWRAACCLASATSPGNSAASCALAYLPRRTRWYSRSHEFPDVAAEVGRARASRGTRCHDCHWWLWRVRRQPWMGACTSSAAVSPSDVHVPWTSQPHPNDKISISPTRFMLHNINSSITTDCWSYTVYSVRQKLCS